MLKNFISQFDWESLKKYFLNTSWMVLERVVRMGLTLVVGVYIARYLGPDRFGLLSFASSYAGLFMVLANMGIDDIVIRELVKDGERRDVLLGTAFSIKISGALLALLVITLSSWLVTDESQTRWLIFIVACSNIFTSFTVIEQFFQSKVMYQKVVAIQFVQMLLVSAIKIAFMVFKCPLIYFATAFVLETAFVAFGLLIIYTKNHLSVFRWQFDRRLVGELLKASIPIIIANALSMMLIRLDQVMLKAMLDNEAVGNYAVAVRLSEAWYFVPTVICSSLYPAIIHAKAKSMEFYHDRIQKLLDLVVWLSVLIVLPTLLFAHEVISIMFGEKYKLAAGALQLHILGHFFIFTGLVANRWLLSENLQKYLSLRSLVAVFINIALNLVLIPRYGINGAAAATSLTLFLVAYPLFLLMPGTEVFFKMLTRAYVKVLTLQLVFKYLKNLLRQ